MGVWQPRPPGAQRQDLRRRARPAGPRTARAATARPPRPPNLLGPLPRARAGRPPALLARQPARRRLGASRAERDAFLDAPDRGPREPAVAGQGARAAAGPRRRARSSTSAPRSCCSPAVAKRLENRETVVLVAEGLGAEEREPFVRDRRRAAPPAAPDPARDRARPGRRGGPADAQRAAPRARRRRARRRRAFRPRCASAAARPAEVKRILFRPPRATTGAEPARRLA